MNLAAAYEGEGDIAAARAQFAAAAAAYPLSAEVSWNYGNFLLRQGETDQGYAQIRKAVLSDRSLLPLASSRVWRASRDINVLLDDVLPADADSYSARAGLFFLNSIKPRRLWRSGSGSSDSSQPMPLSKSFPLIDALVQTDDSADAARVWVEALKAAGMAYSAAFEPFIDLERKLPSRL